MYNLLIILFIIFIIILYINNTYEGFQANTNTLPTTMQIPEIPNKIISNKNLFIDNNQEHIINNLNVNRICIKDKDGTQCITKEELFNALELPIFRRHSMCIDDACITKNNLNKLIGSNKVKLQVADESSKCLGVSKIPGSLSTRMKKRWETDYRGHKKGDLNARLYSSLYEPEGGWNAKPKDFCRWKHTTDEHRATAKKGKGGPCNKEKYPDKGFCQIGYGEHDYDSIEKYGCKARHRSSPNVCWESAGHRCKRSRNDRRRLNKNKKPWREGSNIIGDITTVKQESCSENAEFQIESGKIIDDFNLLNNPYKSGSYSKVAKHGKHIF